MGVYGRDLFIAPTTIATYGLTPSCAIMVKIWWKISRFDRRKLRFSNTAVELQCLTLQNDG
jgi:hypothetical protein